MGLLSDAYYPTIITDVSIRYQHVKTPLLGNVKLYKKHPDIGIIIKKISPMEVMRSFVLRPMNCPHHMAIYKNFYLYIVIRR